MANTCYDNFFLSNEIEDQYQSHLDLQQFCTVDNNLTGVAGMVRKIHKYKATDGTEKLTMGNGNTKTIEAGYTEKEYRIQMAQNRFQYYDEEAMTDPMVITTGTRHAGTDIVQSGNVHVVAAAKGVGGGDEYQPDEEIPGQGFTEAAGVVEQIPCHHLPEHQQHHDHDQADGGPLHHFVDGLFQLFHGFMPPLP